MEETGGKRALTPSPLRASHSAVNAGCLYSVAHSPYHFGYFPKLEIHFSGTSPGKFLDPLIFGLLRIVGCGAHYSPKLNERSTCGWYGCQEPRAAPMDSALCASPPP